jgi:hypothetical protein
MNNEIQAPVYAHYQTVDGNICNSGIITACSFSNLTYNQWLRGSVLLYPLPGIDEHPIYSSYTELYSDYTVLSYPPEVFYFAAISGYDFPTETNI